MSLIFDTHCSGLILEWRYANKNFSSQEVVSQRTRSKLPLTETPLECLEMAFQPPDVTTDMYETEVDNEEWKEFLIDFIHPLSMSGSFDEVSVPSCLPEGCICSLHTILLCSNQERNYLKIFPR